METAKDIFNADLLEQEGFFRGVLPGNRRVNRAEREALLTKEKGVENKDTELLDLLADMKDTLLDIAWDLRTETEVVAKGTSVDVVLGFAFQHIKEAAALLAGAEALVEDGQHTLNDNPCEGCHGCDDLVSTTPETKPELTRPTLMPMPIKRDIEAKPLVQMPEGMPEPDQDTVEFIQSIQDMLRQLGGQQ